MASSGTEETHAEPALCGAGPLPSSVAAEGPSGFIPAWSRGVAARVGGGDTPAQVRRVSGESVGTPSDPS